MYPKSKIQNLPRTYLVKSNIVACFISPHGYGHAARAAAVMEALRALDPAFQFEIYTQVPEWFFQNSLSGSFRYHALLTDVGLAQKNSLVEDLPATLTRLGQLFPFDRAAIQALAEQVVAQGCRLVLCDIAPMGIAVAQAAGLPSLLVENFTWDWIYEGYSAYRQPLQPYVDYLREVFAAADYHIQTQPVSRPSRADLTVAPVSRRVRSTPAQIRRQLEVPEEARLVLLTMGGVAWDYSFLKDIETRPDLYLIVSGGNGQFPARPNLKRLASDSSIFHPDLVNACDAVIGKVGYSTLAEVYQAGLPFGYLERSQFREAKSLVAYIQARMQGQRFTEAELQDGSWLAKLPALLDLPRCPQGQANGADQIAQFISKVFVRPSR
jgi:hypothetical protein